MDCKNKKTIYGYDFGYILFFYSKNLKHTPNPSQEGNKLVFEINNGIASSFLLAMTVKRSLKVKNSIQVPFLFSSTDYILPIFRFGKARLFL